MKLLSIFIFLFVILAKVSIAQTFRFVCDLEVSGSNVEWFIVVNTNNKTIKLPSETVNYKDEGEKIKWLIECTSKPGTGCLNKLGNFNKYSGHFYYFTPNNIWIGKCVKAPDKKLF